MGCFHGSLSLGGFSRSEFPGLPAFTRFLASRSGRPHDLAFKSCDLSLIMDRFLRGLLGFSTIRFFKGG